MLALVMLVLSLVLHQALQPSRQLIFKKSAVHMFCEGFSEGRFGHGTQNLSKAGSRHSFRLLAK